VRDRFRAAVRRRGRLTAVDLNPLAVGTAPGIRMSRRWRVPDERGQKCTVSRVVEDVAGCWLRGVEQSRDELGVDLAGERYGPKEHSGQQRIRLGCNRLSDIQIERDAELLDIERFTAERAWIRRSDGEVDRCGVAADLGLSWVAGVPTRNGLPRNAGLLECLLGLSDWQGLTARQSGAWVRPLVECVSNHRRQDPRPRSSLQEFVKSSTQHYFCERATS
jgi:hypothetical protein